jgi:hypothetical protein
VKGAGLLFVLACAICALIGTIVAAVHGGGWSYAHTIAWSMWIGGSVIVLLVGQSGSTARMAGEMRVLYLGGRFAPGSGIALPQSPLAFIPVGALVIGVGVLVYLA